MYFPCNTLGQKNGARIPQKLLLSLLFLVHSLLCIAADNSGQRQLFLQAQQALQQNNVKLFNTLKPQLTHYPLYPYLEYAELSKQLASTDETEVNAFLTRYADTPLAPKLRNQWLYILAQRQRWEDYLNYYQPTTQIELQCLRRQALLDREQPAAAFADIQKLWLTGQSLPQSCNRLLEQWQQQQGIANALLWQRLSLAIAAKNTALIQSLSAMLPENKQSQLKTWQKLYANPSLLAQPDALQAKDPFSAFILAHCLQRLAEKDPGLASVLWDNLFKSYPFDQQQQGTIIRKIALSLAAANMPQAAAWLNRIPAVFMDSNSREWQIRLALSESNWPEIQRLLTQLPPREYNAPQWQYWLARTEEELGHTEQAIARYQNLAKNNHYYGFLATTRIGQDIPNRLKKTNLSSAEINPIAHLPAIQRAHEFYSLGWLADARTEWQYGLRHLTPAQRYAAAYLATRWGWYECAINTANQANVGDDLTLRFPLAYRDLILTQAKEHSLDPAWIFAVIRQESAFKADARSHVGAMGLMQLMPSTAQLIARQLKQKLLREYEVLEINANVRFGSHYLKQLADRYHGNVILATAAYNAGPGRVHKWLTQRPYLISDVWIETIPWKETRNYVKNILAFQTIYQLHLREKPNLQLLREGITTISSENN